jgi:hypothetical protein
LSIVADRAILSAAAWSTANPDHSAPQDMANKGILKSHHI